METALLVRKTTKNASHDLQKYIPVQNMWT